MSLPAPPAPAKLVIGMFTADPKLTAPLAERLAGDFGPPDLVSPWWAFDFTDYYAAEMGAPLYRRMMSFRNWVAQDTLSGIKLRTNALEAEYADEDSRRRVNIDPGYLLPERFVLASGKNFTHRIYIGKGIYADLTLTYRKGEFQCLPWTYPDYADHRIQSFLIQVRRKYLFDIRSDRQANAGDDGRDGDAPSGAVRCG
ncbi:MAG: DUF4416 family protein [Desulfobacterales bacterium]